MVFSKKLQTETVGEQRLFHKRAVDDLLAGKKKPPAGSVDTTTTLQAQSQASNPAFAEDGRTGSTSPATNRESLTGDSSGFYSAEEVSAKLGKDVDEVWEMVYRDQLPIVWVGGKRAFPEGAVKDLLGDWGAPEPEAEGALWVTTFSAQRAPPPNWRICGGSPKMSPTRPSNPLAPRPLRRRASNWRPRNTARG